MHSSEDQNLEVGKCRIGSVGRTRQNSPLHCCNHLPWAQSGVRWHCHAGGERESSSCLVEPFEFVGFTYLTSAHIVLDWLVATLSKNHTKSARQPYLWSLSSLPWLVARCGACNQLQENLPSFTLKWKKKKSSLSYRPSYKKDKLRSDSSHSQDLYEDARYSKLYMNKGSRFE